MGLFSDIQDAARREARQARSQAEQAEPVEKAATMQQDTQPQEHQPSAKEDPARDPLTTQARSEQTPPAPILEPEIPEQSAPASQPEPEATKQTAPVKPPATPMDDGEAVAASTKRIKVEIERITRKNMKDCVAEHLQERCEKDPAFARAVIKPGKTLVDCFSYINQQAQKFAEQERKDNNITENGVYGCAIPTDLVYQWAVDYFTKPDADKKSEKKPPQRIAKPNTTKASETKTGETKAAAQPKAAPAPAAGHYEQMTLM